ncbi:MAG: c-type cytochrome domain-containing protein [Flavobacteriales bacterium]
MKSITRISFALATLLLTLAIACRHHPEFTTEQPTGNGTTVVPWTNPDPCDPDSVYFANTIAPLLNAYCGSEDCHDAVNPEEDIDVSSYASIMASDDGEFVVPGDLGESKLWDAINKPTSDDDHMPPTDHPQLSSEQKSLLSLWIQQGAQNNSCIADCDTTLTITYSNVVQNIIQNNCIGCHGSTNPSGSLSLTNYNEVVAAANGTLIDALYGTNDVSVMPDGTTGLPQCMIDQIQEWIDNGMPE